MASVVLIREPVSASWAALVPGAAASLVIGLQLVPTHWGLYPFTESLRERHGVAGPAPGTGDLFLTVRQLAQIGACVVTGLLVKRLVGAGLRRMELLAGIVAVLALEGVYAVSQVVFRFREIPFYGPREYHDSASGTLVNRNSFGGMMAMALVLALAAAWARFSTTRRQPGATHVRWGIAWAAAAALFSSCVVLSKSRGGALAAIAGVIAVLFLVRRRFGSSSAVGFVVIASLGTVAVFASDIEPLLERFETIDPDRAGSDLRVRCWVSSLRAWEKQPVLGYGIGSFPNTFRPFQPPTLPGEFRHAHNEYVNLLFEGGIAWLTIVLAAFGTWLWLAFRGLPRLDGSERAAAGACIAAALAVAVHSMVDFDLRITSVGLLFSALVGAAVVRSSTPARSIPRPAALLPAIAVLAAALPLVLCDLESENAALRASREDPVAAERRLAAILRRSPYDPMAAYVQALQAQRRGDRELAAQRLQTATDLCPSNVTFQVRSAAWFLDQEDRDRAATCFRRYFAQRPSAVAKIVTSLWSDEDQVARWEPLMPTPEACANLAMLLASMNRWEDAAGVFTRGVPAEARHVALYDRMATSFQESGQWGLEAVVREERLKIKTDAKSAAAAATVWARLEVWDKALQHIRTAVRGDPGNPEWQVVLSQVLEAKGDRLEAIEAVTEGLRSTPNDPALRRRRAVLYLKEGLYGIAIEDFRAVLKLRASDREATIGLGRSLALSGRKPEAVIVLDAWLTRHPDDEEAARLRASLRQ